MKLITIATLGPRLMIFASRLLLHFFIFVYRSSRLREKPELSRVFRLKLKPIIRDLVDKTPFDRHYLYHVAWAINRIDSSNPEVHYDFGSSLYFIAAVSSRRTIVFVDIRPPVLDLANVTLVRQDLTNLMMDSESIQSLSCMHVLEHVGLGRYGDVLDTEGDIKASRELTRVLAPGGKMLIVVPVGVSTVYFNAHRVYSYQQVVELFHGLTLVEFSLIEEWGSRGILEDYSAQLVESHHYACGLFVFTKPC